MQRITKAFKSKKKKVAFSDEPKVRRLNGYAFDPSLSLSTKTNKLNKLTYVVPWESDLKPGPSGEYIEIIDYDPTIKKFVYPVDLNDRNLLSTDGFEPGEGNPQFHQQMVYAVAMTTIANFEHALGRKVLWSSRQLTKERNYSEYVAKLRLYPHALRSANAYYSPLKKVILFGYFEASPADNSLQMPGGMVFTCLSHDIIAHEVTHAILDGIHKKYNIPSNPDVLAFHEAFADIVALFQHFTFPEVLKHQISESQGNLESQNLLGQLAQELGRAIGRYGSLRDAIGEIDEETKSWKLSDPNPDDYHEIYEPHTRGSILVSAVFDVFLTVYKNRVADLLRIGHMHQTNGELHPDLVNRLAREASKAAKHILLMCIRALDYSPPVDITFGDYLRAIITSDMEILDEDVYDYRLAFIEAFQKRGIYPRGIKTMGLDSLKYPEWDFSVNETGDLSSEHLDLEEDERAKELIEIIAKSLRNYAAETRYVTNRKEIYDITKNYISSDLHQRITAKFTGSPKFSSWTGLAFAEHFTSIGVKESSTYPGSPSFQIDNLRTVSRVGPDGKLINQVVFSIVQRVGVKLGDNFKPTDFFPIRDEDRFPDNAIEFSGGCTMIFDLDTNILKYAISKPLIDVEHMDETGTLKINEERLKQQINYIQAVQNGTHNIHVHEFQDFGMRGLVEPFSFLHTH